MSSLTLTLSGNSSQLRADYFPPLELGEGEYMCGLIDFQTFNSIPNVDERNNYFHLGFNEDKDIVSSKALEYFNTNLDDINKNDELTDIHIKTMELDAVFNDVKVISIPTGSYEIEDINRFLKKVLGDDIKFVLQVNKNTLKCEIFCSRPIDFSREKSIGSLLGFSKRKLKANVLHESDMLVNIIRVNVIRVECNITTGAYINNTSVHTIHEFYPTALTGYKIVEVPRNVIYLPVMVKRIHSLSINIVDQDNQLVNFRGEIITVRIHIKKKK